MNDAFKEWLKEHRQELLEEYKAQAQLGINLGPFEEWAHAEWTEE